MEKSERKAVEMPEMTSEPADKVFRFLPSPVERQPETRLENRRDWGAALDLITEAAEAVRLAEDRTAAAEQYNHQLTQFYSDQKTAMEGKIAALKERAEVAELRADEAEEWLGRLHDAIVTGFKGVGASKS